MPKLSPHFSLEEMGCKCHKCKPSAEVLANLKKLAEMLEIIRARFERPIHVHSAYRCPKYNMQVGGAKDSQHMKGTAADITIEGETPYDIAIVAGTISEVGGIGKYDTFCHVDIRPRVNGSITRWNG